MKALFYIFILAFLCNTALSQSKTKKESLDSYQQAQKFKESGAYDLALKNYFLALRKNTGTNNIHRSIDIHNAVGLTYIEIQNTQEAKKHFLKALSDAEKLKDKLRISYSLNNLGIISENENKLDSANLYYTRSLAIKIRLKDTLGISKTLTNLGNIELKKSNFRNALQYYNRSLKQKEMIGDSHGVCALYNNLGNIYGYLGKFDSTEYYLTKGRDIAEQNGYIQILSDLYHNLAELHTEYKDFETAAAYNELLIQLKDSLFSKTMSKELAKQQVIHEVEVKNKEISILENEKILSTQRSQLMWLTIISLAIITLLLFLLLRYRARKIVENKLTYARQKKIDDLLIKTELQEKNQLLLEKSQVERELVVAALENIKAKEALKDLLSKIEASDKGTSELGTSIKRQLKVLISTNDDWIDFSTQFEKINPNFFNLLDSNYPNLTQTDHRHIAYIKIGLTTKEIARLLNIVPGSVQKSRNRIKKKMKIAEDINLIEFIKSL